MVLGWVIVLNVDATIGGVTSAVGDVLAVPYFVRVKAWDVVIMIALLHTVTVHKVAQGLFLFGGF